MKRSDFFGASLSLRSWQEDHYEQSSTLWASRSNNFQKISDTIFVMDIPSDFLLAWPNCSEVGCSVPSASQDHLTPRARVRGATRCQPHNHPSSRYRWSKSSNTDCPPRQHTHTGTNLIGNQSEFHQ